MKTSLIKTLKLIIPAKVITALRTIRSNWALKKIQRKHQIALEKVKEKDIIKVIFLVIHDSVWKYEEVYKLLANNPKFSVAVVVIPHVIENEVHMETYDQTFNFFQENKYNVIGSYESHTNTWIDIKNLIKPDVVFFTNPHKLTFDKYYIDNFNELLTCYVPYAFVVIHAMEMHYNPTFHHKLWKLFLETKFHKVFSDSFKIGNVNNTIVTGFPGLDVIYNTNFNPINPWKVYGDTKTTKIIWAPHHTIEGQGSGLDYASFSHYYAFFIEYLEKNKNVQIAFKPHPLLKQKLYKDKQWGKVKTDAYYNKWRNMANGQLEESNYIALFYYSDAMVMDSASFIVEYLYFNKPIQFTKADDKILERFNTFGQSVFNYLYQAYNVLEIENFIAENVMNKNDHLKESRNKFLKEVVLPINGKTASENIYTELINELC